MMTSIDDEDTELLIANSSKPSKGPRTFTVALTTGECTRCPDRHHLQLPCRHIVAAVYSQSGSKTTTAGAYKHFHPAYTAPSYAYAFQHVTVSLPFIPALLSDSNIQPPPLYNQAGGSSRVAKRDVVNRESEFTAEVNQKALAHHDTKRRKPSYPARDLPSPPTCTTFSAAKSEHRKRKEKKTEKVLVQSLR